jgi:uncharacterized iron-regulated protein
MTCRAISAILASAVLAACTPSWSGSSDPMPAPTTAPTVSRLVPSASSFRVVETATGSTVPFSSLIGRAALADVIFFGEQHDDPETHFLEFALLEGLGQRHAQVVLSLEMFERDVQSDLDRYLAGTLSEADFLAAARPWPRYATDYRPMVQLARARGWRVIAANIPRPMATAISRRGMRALDTLSTLERQRAAAQLICPSGTDAYYRRFAAEMSGHSAGGGPPTASDSAAAQAMTLRFYEAQCAKDETMAESIAREFMRSSRRTEIVLHVNGAFHSDFGQGTAERVRRRLPDMRTLLITAVPVEDPAVASIGNEGAKADYVIFTRAAVKK